jgi:hypothetical protein
MIITRSVFVHYEADARAPLQLFLC